MEELRRNDPDAYRRLAQLRTKLVVSDGELGNAAGRIANRFRGMSRPLSPHEKADQWVVALGEMRGLTVVTQEGDRPGRMPSVCKELELPCTKLDEMLQRTAPSQ